MSSETTVKRLKTLMWQAHCTAWSDGLSAEALAEPSSRWRHKLHTWPGAQWDDPSNRKEDDGQFHKRHGLRAAHGTGSQ